VPETARTQRMRARWVSARSARPAQGRPQCGAVEKFDLKLRASLGKSPGPVGSVVVQRWAVPAWERSRGSSHVCADYTSSGPNARPMYRFSWALPDSRPRLGAQIIALWQAARDGNVELVKDILEGRNGQVKVSIDVVTTSGQTALHLAAKWGRIGVVRALVESGANLKLKDDRGKMPEDVADEATVQALVGKQSNVRLKEIETDRKHIQAEIRELSAQCAAVPCPPTNLHARASCSPACASRLPFHPRSAHLVDAGGDQ